MLRDDLPCLSHDIDFVGDRDTVSELAKAAHGRTVWPARYERTVLVGIVSARVAGKATNIEVLHTLGGLDTSNFENTTQAERLGQAHIRVLEPISLLYTKAHALVYFDQADRNDLSHFRLGIACARCFIEDVLNVPNQVRDGLWQCERLVRLAAIGLGTKVLRRYGLSSLNAIPVSKLESLKRGLRQTERGRIVNFLKERLPRIMERLQPFGWEKPGEWS